MNNAMAAMQDQMAVAAGARKQMQEDAQAGVNIDLPVAEPLP
jgi:hypothetical protein